MKERYLNLMERVVRAYTDEHIDAYIEKVEENGIKEHGFPRLTANIGILIAYGRLEHLKDRFLRMMDLCCRDIPTPSHLKGRRGNDFSVREILLCILEAERVKLVPEETTARWREAMSGIDPYLCYRVIAPTPVERICNWAAFNAAGEQLRVQLGLGNNRDFIENQVASQMLSFDENGMFLDPFDNPMVYDLVPRAMLTNVLHFGYNGIHQEKLETLLEKGALCSLKIQSVTGELPYGGRSNQFLHNEGWMAQQGEYWAVHFRKKGDMELAGQFRRMAEMAIENIEKWLDENGNHHVKNRFPLAKTTANHYLKEKEAPQFGCETYAYYDKYMVTCASQLYNALMFCDESIPTRPCPAETGGILFETGEELHRVFVNIGGYFLQFDKNAEDLYDATGLGRIHKKDAPGPICLSVPVSKEPHYGLDAPNPCDMAIAPMRNGELAKSWELTDRTVTKDFITTQWLCRFSGGETCRILAAVSQNGVDISVMGDAVPCSGCGFAGITEPTDAPMSEVSLMLPAFDFDGAEHTELTAEDASVSIGYKGWVCRYETHGRITDTGLTCGNRNGKYRIFKAESVHAPSVHITIEKA